MQEIYIVPPCDRPVNILYQDEHLLLIEKPDLLLSIPGRHPLNQDCMISRIRVDFPSASVVHRLDLDTSGIMVVPLTKAVHSHISRQFQERRVEKTYQAIVFGLLAQDSGEITLPIAPDWSNRPRQKICAERGKNALTRYEVIERDTAANCTRLLLKPVTGRSHQLRIHLAEIDHPILGCDMYAHADALAMAPRLMLHAATLGFEHPATGVWLEGESPQQF
ncbi:RNA pseudouridine synthase [Halieaceae bacterium IMCC14734]|uniref:RNA pseudouridine synthase n=1 Tax=Candidatus Litorirhabdus singularis TaxID=2518993 RepID=A0ABT3TG23_9GAMM|nr:pseudouridine synthase [Candidatus Litorirhabdus singularis]MCX2981150.1 RNA pseudouridine synthase [Candidatus Litorirhabdus singularis]